MKNLNITFTTILFTIGYLALCPITQAVNPPPDGGYAGGNTAEGQSALLSLSNGIYNTAVGIYSLLSLTEGSFCTGIGARTLLVNTADQNTATGAGALLSNYRWRQHGQWNVRPFSNSEGTDNTAIGKSALLDNTGSNNTAIGNDALFNNQADGNTATGFQALSINTTGFSNTAVGAAALLNNTTGSENTAIGNNTLLSNTIGNSNSAIGPSHSLATPKAVATPPPVSRAL